MCTVGNGKTIKFYFITFIILFFLNHIKAGVTKKKRWHKMDKNKQKKRKIIVKHLNFYNGIDSGHDGNWEKQNRSWMC